MTKEIRTCISCKSEKHHSEFSSYPYKTTCGNPGTRFDSRCRECNRLRSAAKPRKTDNVWSEFRRNKPKVSTEGNKICRICLCEKPISEFYKHKRSSDGHGYECKPCKVRENVENFRNHPERVAPRNFRAKLRKYGLNQEQYDELMSRNYGRCEICNEIPTKPSIDHCHETGVVRGILCHTCNLAIGLVKDNVKTIMAMATYVERYKKK